MAITIFENGKLSDGWESIELPNPKAGAIYFGFKSSKKYLSAPGDHLRIELLVKRDLRGIGPTQTGVLPAGRYISEGGYSGLLDEYVVPRELANLPEEALSGLREGYEFMAFLENWEKQWSLEITDEEGWLTPDERAAFEKQMRLMAEEDAKQKH